MEQAIITLSWLTCICLLSSIIKFFSCWRTSECLAQLRRAAQARQEQMKLRSPINQVVDMAPKIQERNQKILEDLKKSRPPQMRPPNVPTIKPTRFKGFRLITKQPPKGPK